MGGRRISVKEGEKGRRRISIINSLYIFLDIFVQQAKMRCKLFSISSEWYGSFTNGQTHPLPPPINLRLMSTH